MGWHAPLDGQPQLSSPYHLLPWIFQKPSRPIGFYIKTKPSFFVSFSSYQPAKQESKQAVNWVQSSQPTHQPTSQSSQPTNQPSNQPTQHSTPTIHTVTEEIHLAPLMSCFTCALRSSSLVTPKRLLSWDFYSHWSEHLGGIVLESNKEKPWISSVKTYQFIQAPEQKPTPQAFFYKSKTSYQSY